MRVKKTTNFFKRLVVSYTLIFSVLMTIILIIATSEIIQYSDKQRTLNHNLLINQPLKEMESIFSVMDDTAYRVMGNPDIVNQFISLQNEDSEIDDNLFERNILKGTDIASILKNINSANNPSWRLSVYTDRNDFVSTGANTDKKIVNDQLDSEEILDLMNSFKQSEIDFYIFPPEEDKWSNYFTSEYFSVIRPIRNIYSNDIFGIVEVQNNKQLIEEALSFEEGSGLYVNVFDENGQPVLLQNTEDEVVSEVSSEKYKWTIQLVEAKVVRQKNIATILLTMIIVGILISLMMYLITKPIIRNVTEPLRELTTYLGEINPSLVQEIPHIDTAIDEIIILENAFKTVLEEYRLLTEYEKTAYFMALQSQINPHFIFNVLSVINAAAIEEDYEMVMNICIELSKMLRYSSSFDSKVQTLEDEVEYTESYLKLMKARYEDQLEYKIKMDKELSDLYVPKLILQPICENCFTHAFSDIEAPYKLEMQISKLSNGYSFTVIDNGKGFTDSRRAKILESLNGEIKRDFSEKIGGLGLSSTILRLKLFTKKEVRCEIYKEGENSVVKILVFDANSEIGLKGGETSG